MRALIFASLLVATASCGGSTDDASVVPDEQDGGFTPAGDDASIDVSVTDTGTTTADTATTDGGPVADSAKPDAVIDAGSTCRTWLSERGVTYKLTSARGVVDAINILGPINGVLFANGTDTKAMGDPVACEFAQTLYKFAELLKSKGFVRVGTLGSYCYRCCCAWSSTNYCRTLSDPEPDCSADGFSNHSFGRALDVRYLYKADGTRYDINDPRHWVLSSSTTCTTALAAQTGISRELYVLACEATSTKVFGIMLTPNYNSVHRNHFHMDVGRSGTPTSFSTKLAWDPGFRTDDPPAGTADDHCGIAP